MNSSLDAENVMNKGGFSAILYSEEQKRRVSLSSLRIETDSIMNAEDIYIGPSGIKPKISSSFCLNKNDLSGLGTVDTLSYNKGLFIGLIENNTGISDLGETLWLFKFKAPDSVRWLQI